jgi:flagellar export protein FliJ
MEARTARLQKLLSLRERELDLARSELAKAEAKLRAAEQHCALEQEQLRNAARLHRGDGATRSAQDFQSVSDWLRARVVALEQSLAAKSVVEKAVQTAVRACQDAEREKKKIELVLERIREEMRLEANREEQKTTDELAAQKTAQRQRSDVA